MIEANDRVIGNVFSNDFFFHIPEYQRLYRWKTDQCESLFRDVTGHLEDHNSDVIGNVPEYFLGNIVLVQRDGSPNHYDIIDGQQRLTTLTILFSALHHVETDPAMRDALESRIKTPGDAAMGIAPQPRLMVRGAMSTIFGYVQNIDDAVGRDSFFNPDITTQTLLNRAPTEVEETVRRNAVRLRTLVSELDENRRHRLIQFLNQRCVLVVAKTDNVDAAMLIFQVMNDRGLDLSTTDVLKPEILGAANDQTNLAMRWEAVEEALGSDDFQNLFSHIRFIYGRNEIRGSLTARFREQVLNQLPENGRGEYFVSEVLEPYKDAFERASEPQAVEAHVAGTGGLDQAPEIRQIIENLNELDSDSWRPVVMFAFRRQGQQNGFGWDRFLEFLRKFEAVAYSLAVRGANKSKRAQRFAGIIAAMEKYFANPGPNLPDQLNLTDIEWQETLAVLNGPIYNSRKIAKAVLLLLDRAMAEAGANYDHKTISIEHVLPQTLPAEGWNAGDGVIWGGDGGPTAEQHAEWLNRLANLVLLSRRRNIQASNWPYEEKKNTYFFRNGNATPFVLTNRLGNVPAWTPGVLEERQNTLIRFLATRWGTSDERHDSAVSD